MGVGAGLYMYDVVVKMFTFAISSTDEFLSNSLSIISVLYHFQLTTCSYVRTKPEICIFRPTCSEGKNAVPKCRTCSG